MNFRQFELERYMAKYEFNVQYAFSSSDPQSYTIDKIFNLTDDPSDCYRQLGKLELGYTESQGSPELRQIISKSIYDGKQHPDTIIVHSGAQEAIFTFCTSFLKPNDHVIVMSPCYQSLFEIPRACGCNVSTWDLIDSGHEWILDLKTLRTLINERTRLLIINVPHNPTGYLLTRNDQQAIIEIAREMNIFIFSDEVYRYSEQNKLNTLPSFVEIYDKSVSLGVTSKAFSLPGLRIGWICSPDQQTKQAILQQKDYTTICNSAPSEFIAKIAIANCSKIVDRNLLIFMNSLLIINQFFSDHQKYFQWNCPQACTVGFVKIIWQNFPQRLKQVQGKPCDLFCQDILEKCGILFIPGSQFEFNQRDTYDTYFRLSFCRTNTEEMVQVFRDYMIKWIL